MLTKLLQLSKKTKGNEKIILVIAFHDDNVRVLIGFYSSLLSTCWI
jgi:hypothetical protein